MKKAKKIEIIFTFSGALMVALIIWGLISTLSFLSASFISAFTFAPKASEQIKFDIEGAKSLKL